MTNIIRFPEPRPDRAARPKSTAPRGDAEILFFTGVRYSRRGQKGVERAQRRRDRKKAEA